ncbi:MAG TPA: hypothetical protein VFQ60_01510 [Patescibacteria group bacterium]|nr:hypothetical protein [Patescibacteria group bacterium]
MPAELVKISRKPSEIPGNPLVQHFLASRIEDVHELLERLRDSTLVGALKQETRAAVLEKLTEILTRAEKSESSSKELSDRVRNILDTIYGHIAGKETPKFFENFQEKEQEELVSQTNTFELTEGCSVGCSFCAMNSPRGIKGQMLFSDLTYLIKKYGHLLTRGKDLIFLYRASDPLDYEDGDKTIQDAIELFHFYGIYPFTSTGYPRRKKELLKKLLAKGYVQRVSVSNDNVKILEKDGWLTQLPDKSIETDYAAIKEGLDQKFDMKSGERYFEVPTRDVSAGRALSEKEPVIGGIECALGVSLRLSGFFNSIVCYPSKEHETGIIDAQIKPENIREPIRSDHLPKTADKLLPYGIVEQRKNDLYGNFQYFILRNFSHGITDYFIEYDPHDLRILDLQTVRPQERPFETAYVNARKIKAEMIEEPDRDSLYQIVMLFPGTILFRDGDEKSIFVKKLAESLMDTLEAFITSPKWKMTDLNYLASSSLAESDPETAFDRDEAVKVIRSFRNAFFLARKFMTGITESNLKKIENSFFEQLHELCDRQVVWNSRLSRKQRTETFHFLDKIFQ